MALTEADIENLKKLQAMGLDTVEKANAWRGQNPSATPLEDGTLPDSGYLTFMRGLGASEEQARSAYQSALDTIHQSYGAQRDTRRLGGESERKNINDDAEVRGTYLGGQRIGDLARQRSIEERDIGNLGVAESGAVAQAGTNLNSTLADLARQRAEAEIQLKARRADEANQKQLLTTQEQIRDAQVTAAGAGGGGGGFSFSMPSMGPALPQPAQVDPNLARLQSMTPEQAADFSRWVAGLQAAQAQSAVNAGGYKQSGRVRTASGRPGSPVY